ncbi:MAG: DUF6285 domain-containing protein [Ilumatobacter sp.]
MTLHGNPTSAELIEAVREWIEGDLMAGATGRTRFHARVAANMLAMVERELAVDGADELEHRERLAGLGIADNAEFATAIRAGELDDRLGEVLDVLRADVASRLAIANPRYVER